MGFCMQGHLCPFACSHKLEGPIGSHGQAVKHSPDLSGLILDC